MKKLLPLILLLFPTIASAANDYGLGAAASRAGIQANSNIDVVAEIGKIIGIALGLVGVIFLILMIYGGIVWMTARGDKAKVDESIDTVRNALIGLIIVISAYLVSAFVFSTLAQRQAAGGGGSGGSVAPGASNSGSSGTSNESGLGSIVCYRCDQTDGTQGSIQRNTAPFATCEAGTTKVDMAC